MGAQISESVSQEKIFPADDPLLTEEQAAEFLNISAGSLSRWRCGRKKSSPKYVLLGTAIRYRRSALSEFIEQQTVTPERGPAPNMPRRRGGPGRPRKVRPSVPAPKFRRLA